MPKHVQVGSRMLPLIGTTTPLGASWAEHGAARANFGAEGDPKIGPKMFRPALGLSKNCLWKGVQKKRENLMNT